MEHTKLPLQLLQLLQRIETSDPALTKLELTWHSGFTFAGCRVLARALSRNTCITSLDLHGSSFGVPGARLLFSALTHLTGMTYLNLSNTGLESSGASQLCNALTHLTAMTALNVASNKLTADDGARICGAAAAARMMRLETLDVHDNHFYDSDFVGCEAWGQLNLPQPPEHIVSKDLAFTVHYLMSSDKAAFAESYFHPDLPLQLLQRIETSDPALTKLEVKWKINFKEAGCRVLARALSLNTCITSLDLYNTSVGDGGARLLFSALTHLTGMTYLNLSNTGLESSGASQLCNALTHLTAMTALNVYYNKLTADDEARICGAAAAARMMRLETLCLGSDSFSSAARLFGCEAWGQLKLPQPPDNIVRKCSAPSYERLNCAPLVLYVSKISHAMSLLLNAAIRCPIFGRCVRTLFLQPPAQLGLRLSQRWPDLTSLHLNCRGNQERQQLLISCCPLSTLACRLARVADRHEGHLSIEHRVIALIMRRCFSIVALRVLSAGESDVCILKSRRGGSKREREE
jgi:hypothetical protein